MAKRRPAWDAGKVRALRQHMGLTQEELAQRMGTRQQTISEWETGMYAPRGVSERMLGMVAEQAGFQYEAGTADMTESREQRAESREQRAERRAQRADSREQITESSEAVRELQIEEGRPAGLKGSEV